LKIFVHIASAGSEWPLLWLRLGTKKSWYQITHWNKTSRNLLQKVAGLSHSMSISLAKVFFKKWQRY